MIRIFSALLVALLSFASLAQAQDAETPTVIEMIEGNPDSPVELIEYASFTCGHCRNFHADQYQKLRADYIDTGKIRFVYREVFFDRPGLWASMIARCGGQMRYFGMVEMLFENQRDWIGDGEPAGIAQRLRDLGKTAALDEETLDACMEDAGKAQALVDWFTENAERDQINATPTLILNGTKHSNMSYPALSKLLDEALAAAE